MPDRLTTRGRLRMPGSATPVALACALTMSLAACGTSPAKSRSPQTVLGGYGQQLTAYGAHSNEKLILILEPETSVGQQNLQLLGDFSVRIGYTQGSSASVVLDPAHNAILYDSNEQTYRPMATAPDGFPPACNYATASVDQGKGGGGGCQSYFHVGSAAPSQLRLTLANGKGDTVEWAGL